MFSHIQFFVIVLKVFGNIQTFFPEVEYIIWIAIFF